MAKSTDEGKGGSSAQPPPTPALLYRRPSFVGQILARQLGRKREEDMVGFCRLVERHFCRLYDDVQRFILWHVCREFSGVCDYALPRYLFSACLVTCVRWAFHDLVCCGSISDRIKRFGTLPVSYIPCSDTCDTICGGRRQLHLKAGPCKKAARLEGHIASFSDPFKIGKLIEAE